MGTIIYLIVMYDTDPYEHKEMILGYVDNQQEAINIIERLNKRSNGELYEEDGQNTWLFNDNIYRFDYTYKTIMKYQ